MSRLSRKEMKKDEVREGAALVFHYLQENARAIAVVLAVVLVAILAAAAWVGLADSRREKANAELAAALEIYQAPIGDGESQSADAPSFASEEERAAAARDAFGQIYDRLGTRSVGPVAAAYLADLAARDGDLEMARKLWQEAATGGTNMLTAQLTVNRMAMDRASGRAEEVLSELEGYADNPDSPLPQVVVLEQKALTLETLGRDLEARDAYQRIVDEFPNSPYAVRAGEELR